MFRACARIHQAALFSAAFLLAQLSACAGPDAFGGSRQAVIEWAEARGFVKIQPSYPTLATALTRDVELSDLSADARKAGLRWPVLSLLKGQYADTLTVYIEGDGAPWVTPWQPPPDPTPLKPIALALASQDPSNAVAYLGRPCQYLDTAQRQDCPVAYWTDGRFAPEVIDRYDQILDQLASTTGARQLTLIGYSGGGVLAALLAARRDDVRRFITIAAPLSLAEWTGQHGISPLVRSIDPGTLPAADWQARGMHLIGSRDKIVPSVITEKFVQKFGGRMQAVERYDHECCWTKNWRDLLNQMNHNDQKEYPQ